MISEHWISWLLGVRTQFIPFHNRMGEQRVSENICPSLVCSQVSTVSCLIIMW